MDQINLVHLKYFYDAARTRSISKSAEINHISQSAVSQGIAKLEQTIGISLIVHRPRSFQLTPKGLILYKHSSAIFNQFDAIKEELVENNLEVKGTLRFSCLYSLSLSVLSKTIKQFQAEFPQAHVELQLGHKTKTKELLRAGMIDFGIVIDDDDIEGFSKELLYSGSYKLYVGNQVKKQQLQKLSFLLSEDGSPVRFLQKEYHEKFEKNIPTYIQIASWEMISQLAEEGVGIAFLPDYVEASGRYSLREYDLSLKDLSYNIYAIYHKELKLNRLNQKLLMLLKNDLKPISPLEAFTKVS